VVDVPVISPPPPPPPTTPSSPPEPPKPIYSLMPLIVSKKANLKTETSGGQQNNSDFKGNLYTFDNTKLLDLVNDTTNVPETYWKK